MYECVMSPMQSTCVEAPVAKRWQRSHVIHECVISHTNQKLVFDEALCVYTFSLYIICMCLYLYVFNCVSSLAKCCKP